MGQPSYRRYVEDMIRRFDLNVKLLGWVSYEDLPYVYSAADVTVVPSYSEGPPSNTRIFSMQNASNSDERWWELRVLKHGRARQQSHRCT